VTTALNKAVDEGFSRLPVFRKDDDEVDDVVGVVYVKDLVKVERNGRGSDPIIGLMHHMDVIPETKLVAEIMRNMQANKYHMAMVADEYGTIVGLVTLEDCLEELVGEIVDEHDEEHAVIQAVGNGEFLVAGSLPITKVNDELELALPEKEYDTLGGFIFGELGKVPSVGDFVEWNGWRFTVDTLDGRRIQRVRVTNVSV
jgi:CBS domain containing-hemolysin-like protein